MRILLIDDDKNITDSIKEQLSESMVVDVAYSGRDGEYLALINDYDLIILDNVLPDISGTDVCQNLRMANIRIPILFITVLGGIRDKVTGLDAGADDYITKPFSLKELNARIRAIMRRNIHIYNNHVLKVDDLLLDTKSRAVSRKNSQIYLRKKEFNLLEYMIRNQDRILTRSMILENVWEDGIEEASNTVDVHIKYLRDKIDKPFGKKLINTVYGLGYKLKAESKPVS